MIELNVLSFHTIHSRTWLIHRFPSYHSHIHYNNVYLIVNFPIAGNDLDSIRALFSEKEKELSLAVAKVEALTKQLEELRRDRRGTLNLISSSSGGLNAANSVVSTNGLTLNGTSNGTSNIQQQMSTGAARELDKLRRELMVSPWICFSGFFICLFDKF